MGYWLLEDSECAGLRPAVTAFENGTVADGE